jgi:hypothetical protein
MPETIASVAIVGLMMWWAYWGPLWNATIRGWIR